MSYLIFALCQKFWVESSNTLILCHINIYLGSKDSNVQWCKVVVYITGPALLDALTNSQVSTYL